MHYTLKVIVVNLNSNTLVSVIIPVYNVAPYLSEALNSVITQTYENLEIIIIDDGSTDGSSDICNKYARKDNRIRVIHQHNRGLSASRNIGLNIMTGDAVAFLDSDDAYLPEIIEKMMGTMNREESDVVICKCTVNHTDEKMELSPNMKSIPTIRQGKYDHNRIVRALVEGSVNHTVWNKLYKKELWDSVRFPEGYVFEDIDTTFRILDLCKFVYVIDESLYLRRIRSGSIINTATEKNISDWIVATKHFESFIEMNTPRVFSEEQLIVRYQKHLTQMILHYLRVYLKNNSKEKTFCCNLRKQIIAKRKKVGGKTLSFPVKLIYFLIRYCPSFLRFVYSLYRCSCLLQKSIDIPQWFFQ